MIFGIQKCVIAFSTHLDIPKKDYYISFAPHFCTLLHAICRHTPLHRAIDIHTSCKNALQNLLQNYFLYTIINHAERYIEVYRSGHGITHSVPLCPPRNIQTSSSIYGSVSKWSWHYAQRAIMPTSQHTNVIINIWKCIEVVITARTRNAVTGQLVRGFESHRFRQAKPKSNTRVFGLGFSFTKNKVLSAFFACRCAVILRLSVFVWVCSYRFIRSSADGFMPRKVLDVRKECVRLSCQRQTKSPSGLSVGGLFAYRHAPERLRSKAPWNKSSA